MRLALAALIAATLPLAALPLAAQAPPPQVLTDTPVVQSLAAQVMGDLGQPGLLLDRGADPHNFQLRPSQATALRDAGLLVQVGPELTPWLTRALDGIGRKGPVLALLTAEGTTLRRFGDAAQAHDHSDHDHDHDHAHAHDDHGHDDHGHDHSPDAIDPHAWLDPANAQVWLKAIAAELARLDPENATTYTANAAVAAAEIAALDGALAAELAALGGRPFVVFHDAYGYLADHYGLTVAGAIALGDAAAPGAARLGAIRDTLRQGGAVCIFPEAQHDPALVATVTGGTATRVGGRLDPAGTTLEPGPGLYADLMRGLVTTIADCLKG